MKRSEAGIPCFFLLFIPMQPLVEFYCQVCDLSSVFCAENRDQSFGAQLFDTWYLWLQTHQLYPYLMAAYPMVRSLVGQI